MFVVCPDLLFLYVKDYFSLLFALMDDRRLPQLDAIYTQSLHTRYYPNSLDSTKNSLLFAGRTASLLPHKRLQHGRIVDVGRILVLTFTE